MKNLFKNFFGFFFPLLALLTILSSNVKADQERITATTVDGEYTVELVNKPIVLDMKGVTAPRSIQIVPSDFKIFDKNGNELAVDSFTFPIVAGTNPIQVQTSGTGRKLTALSATESFPISVSPKSGKIKADVTFNFKVTDTPLELKYKGSEDNIIHLDLTDIGYPKSKSLSEDFEENFSVIDADGKIISLDVQSYTIAQGQDANGTVNVNGKTFNSKVTGNSSRDITLKVSDPVSGTYLITLPVPVEVINSITTFTLKNKEIYLDLANTKKSDELLPNTYTLNANDFVAVNEIIGELSLADYSKLNLNFTNIPNTDGFAISSTNKEVTARRVGSKSVAVTFINSGIEFGTCDIPFTVIDSRTIPTDCTITYNDGEGIFLDIKGSAFASGQTIESSLFVYQNGGSEYIPMGPVSFKYSIDNINSEADTVAEIDGNVVDAKARGTADIIVSVFDSNIKIGEVAIKLSVIDSSVLPKRQPAKTDNDIYNEIITLDVAGTETSDFSRYIEIDKFQFTFEDEFGIPYEPTQYQIGFKQTEKNEDGNPYVTASGKRITAKSATSGEEPITVTMTFFKEVKDTKVVYADFDFKVIVIDNTNKYKIVPNEGYETLTLDISGITNPKNFKLAIEQFNVLKPDETVHYSGEDVKVRCEAIPAANLKEIAVDSSTQKITAKSVTDEPINVEVYIKDGSTLLGTYILPVNVVDSARTFSDSVSWKGHEGGAEVTLDIAGLKGDKFLTFEPSDFAIDGQTVTSVSFSSTINDFLTISQNNLKVTAKEVGSSTVNINLKNGPVILAEFPIIFNVVNSAETAIISSDKYSEGIILDLADKNNKSVKVSIEDFIVTDESGEPYGNMLTLTLTPYQTKDAAVIVNGKAAEINARETGTFTAHAVIKDGKLEIGQGFDILITVIDSKK